MSEERQTLDPFAFARDGKVLEGVVPAEDLSRVMESAPGSNGSVRFAFRGEKDRDGKLFLFVEAEGSLRLQCQRCLDEMPWPFQVSSRLLLVREDQELPDDLEEEAYDAVQLPSVINLLDLLEDEILLELPVVSRHDDCDTPGPSEAGEVDSPFAALAALRGGKV